MNKLQMVQNIILTEVRRVGVCSIDDEKLQEAWNIADKIQAEADKREKEDAEKKRKEMREILNADNTFIEKEGQHFDDINFEVNWIEAPDWASYWFKDQDNIFWWSKLAPYFLAKQVSKIIINNSNEVAPSFGYTGDWRNSLRKRPQ